MITEEKLRIFEKYGGDPDGWARIATVPVKTTMSDADWNEIAALLQKLTLVKRGLVAAEYAVRIDAELAERASTDAVARRLLELAGDSRSLHAWPPAVARTRARARSVPAWSGRR
jgi:hypothetical protein